MNKKEIIFKYRKLISEIKQHNHFYFQEDSPKITDQKYDTLKKILDQEKISFKKN